MRRIETRGPARGQCNICGNVGKLTEDHTPPKACRGIAMGELRLLTERLAPASAPHRAPRRLQSGVSYRSLCARCNSEKLGGEYDPALADFCTQVRHIALGVLHLPQTITVKIEPQRVMRSILGHMAAQGVSRYLKGPITEPLRDYFLGVETELPPAIRLYYWLYPFRHQVLIRDAVRMKISSSEGTLFWLMKFLPLAFMATFDEEGPPRFNLMRLDPYGKDPLDSVAEIALSVRPVVHEYWPEAPDDDGVVMYGEQAHFAKPGHGSSRFDDRTRSP